WTETTLEISPGRAMRATAFGLRALSVALSLRARRFVMSAWICSFVIATWCLGCAEEGPEPMPYLATEVKDPLDLQLIRKEVDATVAAPLRAQSAYRPAIQVPLLAGEPVTSEFGEQSRLLAFPFEGEAALPVVLRATSTEGDPAVDPVVLLYRATADGAPFGTAIAYDDDAGGDGGAARIAMTLPESRRYVLLVRRF